MYDLYEVFPSLDLADRAVKIVLPYVKVDNFNRHDLARPYEVLPVDLLTVGSVMKVDLSLTNHLILPIALLDKSGSDESPKLVEIDTVDDLKSPVTLSRLQML